MELSKGMIRRWLYYELKYHIRVRLDKIKKGPIPITDYLGRKILTLKDTNDLLYKKISEGNPFWAGRMGGSEMSTIAYYMRNQLFPFRTDARKDVLHDLCLLSGFFPEDMKYGERFVDLLLDCVKDIDLIGAWNRYMEEWMLAEYAPESTISYLTYLEPWKVAELSERVIPWTSALAGKKVLVIHPFTSSIENQFMNNRTKIFKDLPLENVLPDFELKTLKAVQTLGNTSAKFSDWFEALDYMITGCSKIEFDVAIIGCGAYGFPLAAEIKRMGKIAIHMGGATQLLFGIRGKRWDDWVGVYKKMVNEYWVRPSEEEKISEGYKIENNCYW